jgi:hypothetical protein
MSSSAKNPVPKIRTFAGDLKEQRSHNPDTKKVVRGDKKVPKPTPKEPEIYEAPKMQTPKKTVQENIKAKKPKPDKEVLPEIPKPKKEKEVFAKKPKPTQIPAFHEIQKQVAAMDKNAAEGKPVNVGLDAKIITDTKKGEFKMFPSVFSGIKSWFKQLTKRRKRKKKNEYTIPETSRRKGVIQKATSKSGSIFTDSDGKLKEQIRRRQQQEEEDKIQKENEPETTWSPYTDVGYNLLEAEVEEPVKNVKVEFRQKRVAVPTPEQKPVPVPEVKPVPEPIVEEVSEWTNDPEPVIEEVSEWVAEPEVEKEALPKVEQELPQPPLPEPEQEEVVPTPEIVEEPVVPVEAPPTDTPEKNRSKQNEIEKIDTNTLAVITLLSIIGIVIVIIVSRVLFQYVTGNLAEQSALESKNFESVLKNSTIHSITLDTGSINQLPTMIESAVASAGKNMTEIVILDQDGKEVGPSYIFELLDLQTVPALKQSLTSVRFIASGTKEESIILKFVDETSVRGGLLYWESTMKKDLDSLYDDNLGDTTNITFTDRKLASYDARTLVKDGQTILIYSILDENTAIITTSVSNFAQIVEFGFSD